MERFTKIVATLGPAVASPEKIRELVVAGMDVARLNFSHGDHNLHRRFVKWVREAGQEEKKTVAVLQDISGPKLRVGRLAEGKILLRSGERVCLIPGRTPPADSRTIPIDYSRLLDDLREGDGIVMSDGLIRMTVVERSPDRLVAEVTWGGELLSGAGVAFPETLLQLPAVTDKDRRDLELGIELEVDYVAASFVRTGDDVRMIKELAGGAPVIAKVELAAAYRNLDGILAEAAGVMVARGDLGVQLPLARLPIVQAGYPASHQPGGSDFHHRHRDAGVDDPLTAAHPGGGNRCGYGSGHRKRCGDVVGGDRGGRLSDPGDGGDVGDLCRNGKGAV